MAARAIWKGIVKIGSVAMPVKLYSAVEDRDVHFHVLQSRTKSRVKQQMVRPEDRKQVAREEIRKGYEIEPGEFVVIESQETEKLKPKESREVGIKRFVPPAVVGSEWYERPYYLGPDAEESKYFALVEAIANRKVEGIARWVMRGKSYVGALLVYGDHLLLIKLRYAEEVLSAKELPAASGRALDPKELRMAEELISALEGKFNPEDFRDEYRDRLKKFIEAKAKGKRPRLAAVKARPTGGAVAEQLEKSLAALKRGKEKKVA
jgi:DNA end-binding protein Ku